MSGKFFVRMTVFGIMLIGFLAGCSGRDDNQKNFLSSDWVYSAGYYYDAEETVETARTFVFHPIDRFDDLYKKTPTNPGYIWIKNEFEITDNLKDEQFALTLGRISIADKTYLNGVLIGTGGKFPPDYFSAWNLTRFYTIPKDLLRKGKNELFVKILVNGEGSMSGPRFLGNREYAKIISERDQFINLSINKFVAVMVVMIGVLYMMFFIKRRKDKENLYYSIICFLFSLILSNFYLSSLPNYDTFPLSYLLYQKIIFLLLSAICITGVLFIHSFTEIPVRKLVLLGNIAAVSIPVVIFWIQPDYENLNLVKGKIQLLLAVPVLYTLFIIGLGIVRKTRDIWILLLGLSPLFAANLHDLIYLQIMKTPDQIYLSGYGFAGFIVSMSLILSNRFVRTINEAEDLNKTLEKKVDERTEELTSSNSQLEIINNSLLEINKQLEFSQKMQQRDMTMAVNLQMSLFQKKPPVLAGWDIAFDFRPMTGVSGDFYHFFSREGKLLGVGLFDVSGHGISSGLITMIANSVIGRIFSANMTIPLSRVMKKINAEIIHEIGNVDNYITGILLRFSEDAIEYVNAGHTDLLIKRKDSDTKIVQAKDNMHKGVFLGIEAMQSDFVSLTAKIAEGDAFVLYTDYMIEAENSKKEPYGEERLVKALNLCGHHCSAFEMVSIVMRDLEEFTEGLPQTDDSTLIVIKKG